jgi:sialate O-acetylesterase
LWDIPAGRWKLCVQEEIPEFSALAFFFGMEWNQKHNIPVGLIVSAVGGSPLDAWLDEATLRGFPGPTGPDHYPERLTALRRECWVDSVKQAETQAMAHYRSLFTPDPGPEGSQGWVPYRVPSFWDQADATPSGPLSQSPGSAWFKKVFYLTETQIGHAQEGAPDQDGMLILGTMTDADRTFLNGTQVGSTVYQYPPRIYTIPKGLLKAGSNELLIRIENYWGPGGFTSGKDYALYIGAVHPFYAMADTVSLEGDDWMARMGSTLTNAGAEYPATTTWHYQPAGLYNALLAPLTQLPVKGVIWYQGESETKRRDYGQMLSILIDRWREDWNDDALPFVIVQLPNYMKDKAPWPMETDWANRRDEQLAAVRARKHTALVVTHDIGEWNDIHPLNKKELAHRVVSAAEYLGAGNRKAPLSPLPQHVVLRGNRVVITFSHAGKGLITKDGPDPAHFALADVQGRYFRASARIIGKKKVAVWCKEDFTPHGVRYAWANDPSEANLQNDAGLPAPTFQWNLNDSK